MWHRAMSRLLPAILAGCALALAACGSPASSPAAHHQDARACHLAVAITTTAGSTWGTVTATYGSTTITFTGAEKTVAVPCGTTVTLSQTATSTATWPFAHWTVPGGLVKGSSTTVDVRAETVHATATYVLAGPASSGSGSGSSGGSSGW